MPHLYSLSTFECIKTDFQLKIKQIITRPISYNLSIKQIIKHCNSINLFESAIKRKN